MAKTPIADLAYDPAPYRSRPVLRRSEAAQLRIPKSKTDQEAEGAVLYISRAAAEALQAIIPEGEEADPNAPAFGLSAKQIGRRVDAAAKAAGLGEGFTGHSGRVGMAPGPWRPREWNYPS